MQAHTHEEFRPRIGLMIAAAIASSVVGWLLAGFGSWAAGWASTQRGALVSSGAGAGAMLAAGLLAVGAIAIFSRDPKQAPQAMMAASGVRLLGGLFGALAIATLFPVLVRPFWAGVLGAGMLLLIVETAMQLRGPTRGAS